MSDTELLIEEIRTLPKYYTAEVLDFVGYLKEKSTKRQAEFVSEGCPICAQHSDPETGELRLNAETIAGMKEVEDMLSGKIPNTMKQFNSLDEMLADLDKDD